MGYLSDYLENKLLDHVLKTAAFTQPAGLYLALSSTNPTDTGTGKTEPTGGSYARVEVPDWDAAVDRVTQNTDIIEFVAATAGWGLMSFFAIYDAITNGNMLVYGALSTPKRVNSGDIMSFAKGVIVCEFNVGGLSNYLANALLDHTFKRVPYVPPTNVYAALAIATILDSTTGSTIVEPDDSAYARVLHNVWHAASGGLATNDGVIAFPQFAENTNVITHSALIDALTVGNILFHGELDVSQTIVLGSTPKFVDTAMHVALD
jgi:hypothetical protein